MHQPEPTSQRCDHTEFVATFSARSACVLFNDILLNFNMEYKRHASPELESKSELGHPDSAAKGEPNFQENIFLQVSWSELSGQV